MNLITALGALLVVAFSVLGMAKVAAAPAMRSRAEHVGYTTAAYRGIGTLELLAVAGLLVGLAVPLIGALAAVGLVVLLGGALVVHVRNGDGPREVAPAVVLAVLAAVFAVLVLAQ